MRDQGVRVAALVRMDNHAGRLVRQQDIGILVDDAYLRMRDAAESILLARGFKVFVVQIKLDAVALGETVSGLGAFAVYLDALEAQVFVHHAAGKPRHGLFQKLVQALPAVVFCDIIFSQGMGSFSFSCFFRASSIPYFR